MPRIRNIPGTATQSNKELRITNGAEPRFVDVHVIDNPIVATFSDERTVSVPLWWSWRLEQASAAERNSVQIIGAGYTAYWPDIDEHLSVHGFFFGSPAPRPPASDLSPLKTSAGA
jgi:hypothetical protein